MERLGVLKKAIPIVFALLLVFGASILVLRLPSSPPQPPPGGEEVVVTEDEGSTEKTVEKPKQRTLPQFQPFQGPEGYDSPIWMVLTTVVVLVGCWQGLYTYLVRTTRLIKDDQTVHATYEYADIGDASVSFSLIYMMSPLPQNQLRLRMHGLDNILPELRDAVVSGISLFGSRLSLDNRERMPAWLEELSDTLSDRIPLIQNGRTPRRIQGSGFKLLNEQERTYGVSVVGIQMKSFNPSGAARERIAAREDAVQAARRVDFAFNDAFCQYCKANGLTVNPENFKSWSQMIARVMQAETQRQDIASKGTLWRAIAEFADQLDTLIPNFARNMVRGRSQVIQPMISPTPELSQFREE